MIRAPKKRRADDDDEVGQAASRLWPAARSLAVLMAFIAGVLVAAGTIWAYLDNWGWRPVWIYEIRDTGPARVSLEIYKFHLRRGEKLSPAELARYCGLSYRLKSPAPECEGE